MPQLVLQADWQEVWHSPQPPFLALSQRLRVLSVLICFILFLHYAEFEYIDYYSGYDRRFQAFFIRGALAAEKQLCQMYRVKTAHKSNTCQI